MCVGFVCIYWMLIVCVRDWIGILDLVMLIVMKIFDELLKWLNCWWMLNLLLLLCWFYCFRKYVRRFVFVLMLVCLLRFLLMLYWILLRYVILRDFMCWFDKVLFVSLLVLILFMNGCDYLMCMFEWLRLVFWSVWMWFFGNCCLIIDVVEMVIVIWLLVCCEGNGIYFCVCYLCVEVVNVNCVISCGL